MKGLIFKDIYTVIKSMKTAILILFVFAFMPGYNMGSFAVVYAAMLPITAMAYDERSKWNTLAAMLPYTPAKLILSRYILGGICLLAGAAVALLGALIKSFFGGEGINGEMLLSILSLCCISSIMLALVLPVVTKLGVERGRLVFFLIIAVVAALIIFFDKQHTVGMSETAGGALPLILIAAAVVINALSYAVSVNILKS